MRSGTNYSHTPSITPLWSTARPNAASDEIAYRCRVIRRRDAFITHSDIAAQDASPSSRIAIIRSYRSEIVEVEKLAQLTELHIDRPSWHGRGFMRFCRSPLGASLQQLTISGLSFGGTDLIGMPIDPVPTEEMVEGLPLLTSLHHLDLSCDVSYVEVLLPHLQLISNLRFLRICATPEFVEPFSRLIQLTPLLHIEIHLRYTKAEICCPFEQLWSTLPTRISIIIERDE